MLFPQKKALREFFLAKIAGMRYTEFFGRAPWFYLQPLRFRQRQPRFLRDPFGLSADYREDVPENEIEYGSIDYINILCQVIGVGTDYYSKSKEITELADILELLNGKVRFILKGDYIIVKGNREILAKYGIKQTRIRADNITKFKGIDELLGSQSFKKAFKNSFDAPGVIFDAVVRSQKATITQLILC